MTSALSMHSATITTNQSNNETRPEFSGGSTLLIAMALYALQNVLLKVMKMYSESVAQQKNTSLEMAIRSGENIKNAGIMQATSMMLGGIGSLIGAGFAVGFSAYGSKALKQNQTEMKSVNNKLSIIDKNLNMMETATAKKEVDGSRGNQKSPEQFESMRIRANSEEIKFKDRGSKNNSDIPKIVSKSEMKKSVEDLNKSKFERIWEGEDKKHLGLIKQGSPEFNKLDRSLRSEQKSLHKRIDTLSGEHNAELNKATQRGQLSNSFAQGAGQTSSGIPQVAKGEYDSKAQVAKSAGEQIESSSRQSEDARNQTLQSANHINQILDQLKAAEKA